MRRFVVAETATTRVNPLPYTPLVRPRAAASWDRLLTTAVQALGAARAADDELKSAAGQDGGRPEYVRLRRRIREKPMTPLPDTRAAEAHCEPAVRRWHAAAAAYRDLLAAVTREREGELLHERFALSTVCAWPTLSSSVELVSPDLGHAVRRYAAGAGTADRADRKSEPRITAYALRSMTRTSPRSVFTVVAMSALAASDATPTDVASWEAAPPSGILRAVDVQRGALLSALEPDPGTAGHVRLAPLLPAAASETAFMAITGRPPRPRKVTLRRSRELGELIAACRFGVHPWETLADSLASALDCSVSRALQVMRAALKAGLLAPALPVDDQDPRFLQACLDALPEDDGTQDGGRQDGGRQDGGLRPTLRDITELTGLLATDDAESRPGLMGRLRAAAERLPHPDTLPLRVYEDAVADLPATPRPTTVLRAAADLLPVLAAFDLKADLRLALQAALRVRGGRARLLEDAEGLADEAARLATSAAAGGRLPDPEIQASMDELWRFRHRILADLAALLASAAAAGDGTEAVIGEESVRTWAAALPAWLHQDSTSYALMAQHAAGDWVANSIFGGLGATAARFLHLDAAAGGDATDLLKLRLRRLLGPGAAEDRSAHGFNTGCHPQLLDDVMGPADWARTFLVDDGPPGRLSWEMPRALHPVTVTSTRWDLLPAPSRIALWLQGGGLLSCSYDHVYRDTVRPGADGVLAVPRLRYGNLVLQRRRWYLPDASVLTDAHRGSADDLHRLVRTLAEHGVPARFFVKQLPPWQRGEALVPDVTARPAPQPKPRFVDTAGALGLGSFAKDAADFTHPFLEECLPEPVAGRSVREAVYEFDAANADADADAPQTPGRG
ncbi:lantibiotic dehydratase family protein [Streptomyces sp. NBC_00868]|uniref:lantibiotic dehydratase n=1 Tax=unclassified Streptomyces TaxID=2593676 RepID=UPI0032560E27|nr:lantibiotic dehydratase family protein [Streptomyces sp. NBC_00868]